MYLPNNRGTLFKRDPVNFTASGEATFGAGASTPCSVVSLTREIKKSPIRTDASATRGHADEDVAVSTILFPAKSAIAIGDKFVIAGLDLRCSGADPMYDLLGKLDHLECTFEAWSAR